MLKLSDYTALYSPEDLAYAQSLSGPFEDLCWFGDDGVCIAGKKDGRITGFWRPVVVFGDEKTQKLCIEALWQDSQDILYEDYLAGGVLSPISKFLLRHNYRAVPHYVQVVDLRNEHDMHAGLRRSYRSLVTKASGISECDVMEMRVLHKAVKGDTRPIATWEIQEQMQTLCLMDTDHGCTVMFYYNDTWAYYASAAGPNTHACIWQALLALRDRGVKYCEMGTQEYHGPDKAVGISKFKAGFSGRTEVRLLLERSL